MIEPSELSLNTYETIEQFVRIGSDAIWRAQEESRSLGVPNVYFLNGRIYYEMPTGELSVTDPYLPKNNSSEIQGY